MCSLLYLALMDVLRYNTGGFRQPSAHTTPQGTVCKRRVYASFGVLHIAILNDLASSGPIGQKCSPRLVVWDGVPKLANTREAHDRTASRLLLSISSSVILNHLAAKSQESIHMLTSPRKHSFRRMRMVAKD
jgi:hypothetical protein